MSEAQRPDPIRSMQVIHAALIAGVVLFTIVATVLVFALASPVLGAAEDAGAPEAVETDVVEGGGIDAGTGSLDVLAYGAAVLGVSAVPVAMLMSRPTRRARPSEEAADISEDAAQQEFLKKRLIGAAVLEGPALLGAVALLLTGNVFSYVAVVVGLAGMMLVFPTERRFRAWNGAEQGRNPYRTIQER